MKNRCWRKVPILLKSVLRKVVVSRIWKGKTILEKTNRWINKLCANR